jgi:hypothetical protein
MEVPHGRSPGAPWRLLGACLGLSLAVVASDLLVGSLLQNAPTWRASQDPRQRILWDSMNDGSPVVLIGDSVFCSFFLDASQETLWDRLSARSQAQVFPAALDGATPVDMVLIARRVAALWPPGTTAFIDIHPARVFDSQTAELKPASQYGPQFRLLVDSQDAREGSLQRLERRLGVELAARSFLVRNQEWILRYLDTRLKKRLGGSSSGEYSNTTWNADGGFALRRFRKLEAVIASGSGELVVPFSWVQSMEEALRLRGIRAVFVLTPLNTTLVREYSDGSVPTEQVLVSSHGYLVNALRASRFEFMDLFDELESAAFSDVIHVNMRGDDALAMALNGWLRERRLVRNTGDRRSDANQYQKDY